MKTHIIPRMQFPIDWSGVPSVSICEAYHPDPLDITATGQICYDDRALYLRLTAREKEIRAEYTGLLDSPCEDSCLEFFFSPIEGDTRYFNIEFNPNCCLYLGIGSCIDDLVRLIPENGNPLSPKAARTQDGWEISYQVPYSFVRRFFPDFRPESGKTIRANFYKCGDLTVHEHYFSWNRITGGKLSFHRPCDFGLLSFA